MIDRRDAVFGLLSLAFTGSAHAHLSNDIDNFEDAISKFSRRYSALSPSEIAEFKKKFAVHFVIIDTKTVKDKSVHLDDSASVWRAMSQRMQHFESRDMILSFDKCSMEYGARQMAKLAKKQKNREGLEVCPSSKISGPIRVLFKRESGSSTD